MSDSSEVLDSPGDGPNAVEETSRDRLLQFQTKKTEILAAKKKEEEAKIEEDLNSAAARKLQRFLRRRAFKKKAIEDYALRLATRALSRADKKIWEKRENNRIGNANIHRAWLEGLQKAAQKNHPTKGASTETEAMSKGNPFLGDKRWLLGAVGAAGVSALLAAHLYRQRAAQRKR